MTNAELKKVSKYPIKELVSFRDGTKWDFTNRIDFSNFGQKVNPKKTKFKRSNKFIVLTREDEGSDLFWMPVFITGVNQNDTERWYFDLWEEEIDEFDFDSKEGKGIPNIFRLKL